MCRGGGRVRFVPDQCDNCPHLKNMGPNMVPYSSFSVNEGDVYECGLGYHFGECEIEEDEDD